MSRRADRLFQLVQLLRVRSLTTAEKLARELGVSQRTVYRDVKDLIASGVPIRGEAGVGYALPKGYELPPLTFTAEEIEALVLGARLVVGWTDPELAQAAKSAMIKVEGALPAALKPMLHQHNLYVPRMPGAVAKSEGLGILRRGISSKTAVRFSYETPDGSLTTRTVLPLGLFFWGAKWSLTSWCLLRKDYRNFRPDRMSDLQTTEAEWPEGVSLEAFRVSMNEGCLD